MKARLILKNCERCRRQFGIPYVRESLLRELMLLYFPCPHCLFSQEPPGNLSDYAHPSRPGPAANPSARCRGLCSLPFVLVKHHARGYCKRDYRLKRGYP